MCGGLGHLVERVRDPLLDSGQQVPVAIEHNRDRRVPRAYGDFFPGRACRDPQRHRGVPQVVESQALVVIPLRLLILRERAETTGDARRIPDATSEQ